MFDKLEFMLALAREKHFRRAAESCGVAQPTLSLGIKSLEDTLNVPLVKRSSRFQGFTPEGERVLVWARRMVGDARAMQQEIFGLQTGAGSHIRIASMPSAISIVSSLTLPFQQRYPDARFTVLARTSDAVVNLLHHRDVDAGVTYIDNDPIEDVIRVPLYREQYVLLTTTEGPFGNAKTVRWSDAASLPLCLLTRDMQHRRIMDNVLRDLGLEATPSVETDSALALISHVETGRWVSIVPRSMLESADLSKKLRAVPIVAPEVSRTIGMIVSQRFPVQPTVELLIRQARELTPASLVAQ